MAIKPIKNYVSVYTSPGKKKCHSQLVFRVIKKLISVEATMIQK